MIILLYRLYIEVDQSMAAVVSLDALAGFTLQYKVVIIIIYKGTIIWLKFKRVM